MPRPVIGLFGEMNAGKSTCLNALTQQATAIVDQTPGTTADVKGALLELHGLGPVKVRAEAMDARLVSSRHLQPRHAPCHTTTQLLDTAGVDDTGELGGKKRAKSLQALKEVDLALLVIDPLTKLSGAADPEGSCRADQRRLALLGSLVAEVTRRGRQVCASADI